MILLLFLIFTKHFIIDFIWQPAYEYLNKGKYGHFGGIQHSFKQAFATFLILTSFTDSTTAIILSIVEFMLHYHIDWAKVNLSGRYNLDAKTTKFWWLLGLDQYLHYLSYLWIVWYIFKSN